LLDLRLAEDFVPRAIRVEPAGAQLAELTCNQAFSAGDAS
jgi:hypothetical protein